MVKNVYECLMCLQCLLCRGLGRGRGRWLFWVTEVGARALSRLAKLFLTTSTPPARHSVWVHLGIFCCSIIPLDDWDNKQGFFFSSHTYTQTHTLSGSIVSPSFSFSLWFFLVFFVWFDVLFSVLWVGLALVEYEKKKQNTDFSIDPLAFNSTKRCNSHCYYL